MINVSGPLRWGKFKIRDFHNYGSELPVKKVISKSSNIVEVLSTVISHSLLGLRFETIFKQLVP